MSDDISHPRAIVREVLRGLPREQGNLKLLCAVSGGEDSHALLHVLLCLRDEMALELAVAHFHHGLRPESGEEAEFVRRLAVSYELPFELGHAPPRSERENVEAWARRCRYEWLEQARETQGAHFIVTAHHADDVVETFLFRLLSGRLATSAISVAELDEERKILRPFLRVPKRSVSEYSAGEHLRFVMDSSNNDVARTRNRLRHSLIPLLAREYNPAVVRTLGEVSARIEDDEDALWRLAAELPFTGRAGHTFLAAPRALQWRALKLVAEQTVGETAGQLGYRALMTLAARIAEKPDESFSRDLGFGVRMNYGRDRSFEFLMNAEPQLLDPEPLHVPGVIERRYIDGSVATIEARIVSEEELPPQTALESLRFSQGSPASASRAFFDAEELDLRQLLVRERSEGDRVRVLQRGERKVKKLLQERGVKLTLRDRLPIVEESCSILWIPGIARSEIAPITLQTKRLLELSYQRIGSSDRVYHR